MEFHVIFRNKIKQVERAVLMALNLMKAALFLISSSFGFLAFPALLQAQNFSLLAGIAGEKELALFNVKSGEKKASIPVEGASSDMMVTAAGVLLLNHTASHQIIAVDMKTQQEIARFPSSSMGGKRPVHSYLTPVINGRQYYVALNDGESSASSAQPPQDSTMLFVDVTPGSSTYLKATGEARLGLGHHKIGFSTKSMRAVVSNIADCGDVLSVYDYSDVASIKLVKSFAAKDFGLDGSSALKTCGSQAIRLSPHGVGTSAKSGKIYHFITGTGQVAIIDADAPEPSMKVVQTSGKGGSAIKDQPGGAFMVIPQRAPREVMMDAAGAPCQIGQLAVLDAVQERLAAQIPIFLTGPDCRETLTGTKSQSVVPEYGVFSPDGRTLFVQLGTLTSSRAPTDRASHIAVFDMKDPYRPRQLPSIPVGAASGHRGLVMSGDGKMLFSAAKEEGSLTIVDVASRKVVKTLPAIAGASRVVTYDAQGRPSKPVGPATASY
jgi:hypothetical protein